MSALPSHIGAYEVVRLLGKGGMAIVYLGRDPAIDRHVAIKLLRESLDSVELRERFAREAKSAGRLRHQNIVTVFQVGVHDNAPFIVMEYIPGESLAEVIRRQPSLTLTWKLRVMEDLCRGLAYAHKSGVVHRDMKPANIQIDLDGGVKILDFGIARLGEQKAGEQALTRLGMMMGTPNYMAPEQINPGTADHRSDVFAVGLIFYELLTYRRAFGGDSYAVLHNILNLEPDPVEQHCPGIDPAVVAIVTRALAKDPEARYQDLGDMRDEIKRIRLRLRSHSDDGSDEGPVTAGGHGAVDTEATRLADRRTEISRFLDAAKSAYDSKEFQKAIELCEQVLKLDPALTDAKELGSLASGQLTLAHARDLLAAGQEAFAAGSLDEAAAHIREVEALQLPPDTGATVLAQLSALARAVSTATERQRVLRERMERARQLLADGALDGSAQAVDEALALSPGNREALALRTEVRAAIDAERARQRAAEDAVGEARLRAESGHYDEAIALLEQYRPAHPLVTWALDDIRALYAEAQRRAAEERRRQEHAEAAQAELMRARQAADKGDPAGALKLLAFIDFADPSLTSDALERVHAEADILVARCEADQHLQSARAALAADNLNEAAASLDRARQRYSNHPDVATVAAAIEKATTVLERLGRARAELDKGELESADRLLAEALTLAPKQREALQLRERVRAGIAEREAAVQRAAEDATNTARREAEHGEFAKAIARLKDYRPAHAAVTKALSEIVEQQAAAERRAADERRRQEHAARARTAVKAARAAADQGDPAAALMLVQGIEFDGADVRSSALDELRAEAQALIARCEADQASLESDAAPDPTVYLSRGNVAATGEVPSLATDTVDDVPPATLVQMPEVAPPTLIQPVEAPPDRTVVIPASARPPAAPKPAPAPAAPAASAERPAPATPAKPAPAATVPTTADAPTPAKRGLGAPVILAVAAALILAVAVIWWATRPASEATSVAVNETGSTVSEPAETRPTAPAPTPVESTPVTPTRPLPPVAAPTPTPTPTPAATGRAAATPAAGRGTPPSGRGSAVPPPSTSAPAQPPAAAVVTPVAPQPTSSAASNTATPAQTPVVQPPAAATPMPTTVARAPEPVEQRPATPPQPDPGRDEAAIRAVLAQLSAGYRQLDAGAIRRLWPSAPGNLQQSFNDARSYEFEVLNPEITVRGDAATVSAVRRIRSQPKAGRVQETSLPTTFSLRRAGSSWLIDSIR